MEQPLYGGLAKETMQAEYLLTTTKSKVSHPYLPPIKEGKVRWQGKSWFFRYFRRNNSQTRSDRAWNGL